MDDIATTTSPAPDEAGDARALRINITIRPETKARLDLGRNKKGLEINVSQVCDRAINAELDRLEKPGLVDVVARLRVESDRRRGEPYRAGHQRGRGWAETRGSWAEICYYAQFTEDDVRVEEVRWTSQPSGTREWLIPGFRGNFKAPIQDYGKNHPHSTAAPAYLEDERADPEYAVWIVDPHKCDQFWRGWLAGVKEVFGDVSKELEPISPVAPADTAPWTSEPTVQDVDPDDIPF